MKNVSIDFDGVIHAYTTPWTTALEISDGPVEGAFDFIRATLKAGYGIHILTARANDPGVEQVIVQWFLKHGLEFFYVDRLNISPLKKGAIVYIDDRGWRFEGKWPTLEEIEALQQWNRREG
jgi:hypothetical protein